MNHDSNPLLSLFIFHFCTMSIVHIKHTHTHTVVDICELSARKKYLPKDFGVYQNISDITTLQTSKTQNFREARRDERAKNCLAFCRASNFHYVILCCLKRVRRQRFVYGKNSSFTSRKTLTQFTENSLRQNERFFQPNKN